MYQLRSFKIPFKHHYGLIKTCIVSFSMTSCDPSLFFESHLQQNDLGTFPIFYNNVASFLFTPKGAYLL